MVQIEKIMDDIYLDLNIYFSTLYFEFNYPDLQFKMNVQYSELLGNHETPTNSTQVKIIKLLDELKKPESKTDKYVGQQLSSEVKNFKKAMTSKFQNICQKLETATGILYEVERQANQMVNHKHMLRMKIQFEDNVKEIEVEAKQFYTRKQKQRKQLQKYMLDRMLKIKLLNGEQDSKIKYEMDFNPDEFINREVNRSKKLNSRQKESMQLKRMEFTNKIKTLKRSIQEDSHKNKEQRKRIKNNFLQVCENITEQIQKQQKAIHQSFNLHSDTLQKLVISISQRIQQ